SRIKQLLNCSSSDQSKHVLALDRNVQSAWIVVAGRLPESTPTCKDPGDCRGRDGGLCEVATGGVFTHDPFSFCCSFGDRDGQRLLVEGTMLDEQGQT